jgi:hypothetical protein
MKIFLIQEMQKGYTSSADEKCIIRLLQEAEPGDRTSIIDTIGRSSLWEDFSGDNRIIIEAMTLTQKDFSDDSLITRLKKLPGEKLDLYRQNAIDPVVKANIEKILHMQKISTPLGMETEFNERGEVPLKFGHFELTIKPDAYDKTLTAGAEIKFSIESLEITAEVSWSEDENKVERLISCTDISTFKLSFRTTYGSGKPTDRSAYGRGTTREDRREKRTTLRFHEGSHGLDYLHYFRTFPHPELKWKKGMTRDEFDKAQEEYGDAITKFIIYCYEYSTKMTDCAGETPISPERLKELGRSVTLCRE